MFHRCFRFALIVFSQRQHMGTCRGPMWTTRAPREEDADCLLLLVKRAASMASAEATGALCGITLMRSSAICFGNLSRKVLPPLREVCAYFHLPMQRAVWISCGFYLILRATRGVASA